MGVIRLVIFSISTILLIGISSCSEDVDPMGNPNQPNPPNTGGPVTTPGDATGTADIPAFPGAEGFGAYTVGGRGGRVITVTNLNDRGPGSLRSACEISEPRIIVFAVGGTINLRNTIQIRDPFITIAGQTAPGDGISLSGDGISIHTNNVVIRGLRVRVGDDPDGSNPNERDGISIGSVQDVEIYNVIVDHCSISWAIDENTSINNGVHDVTFQWNIISEGLYNSIHNKGPHSMGMLIGKNEVTRVSVHHNYFAHNYARNPRIALDVDAEVVNNLIYNYGSSATKLAPGAEVNAIGNIYQPGSDTEIQLGDSKRDKVRGILIDSINGSDFLLYVKENIGPGRLSNDGNEWGVVFGDKAEQFRSMDPVPGFEPTGIKEHSVDGLAEIILADAGAIIPIRDAIDSRVVEDFRNQTGKVIDSQNEVGGWVIMADAEGPLDSDNDGMPDTWEEDNGLNPNDAADSKLDRNNDGYTNVEEYINSFFD
jgi:pectate lyase